MNKMKIKKGDIVVVTTGKDKGKSGKVEIVLPRERRLVVSGINIVTKHAKPTKSDEGGLIKKNLSIHVSNVAYLDSQSGKATKVGYKILEDGKKARIAKISGEVI